jgi:hypothetical protein
MADIKLVRLLTGEEVLGEFVEQDANSITLKNLVRVVIMPNKAAPEQPGVAFAPFSHWTKDKLLKLNTASILTIMEPITEFVNQYNATFGGIVVPDSKLIIPGQ